MQDFKSFDNQSIQNEKMISLGMATSGIIHEISNLLTAINSNIDLNKKIISLLITKENIANDSTSIELVNKLKNGNDISAMASERMIEIVKSIKNFSRNDNQEFRETNIHDCIDSTLILLTSKFKNRINIAKEYGDLPFLKANSNQINQVFMNILANAMDAIPQKGTITITTYIDASFVCISIKDSGMGISHENLNKIFETGFTTKEVGKGTGLGLAIVNKIIQNHNGKIAVNSKIGVGTEFIIKLPLIDVTLTN